MPPTMQDPQRDQDFDALEVMAAALRRCCDMELSDALRLLLAGQARQLGLHQIARISADRGES